MPDKNVDPFTKLSELDPHTPMLSHLLVMLDELRDRASFGRKRIGRRLYLFFSGHGVSPRGEIDEAGLVTVDARGRLDAFLPGKQSADQFCLTARFDEVLLFMDCCRVTNILLEPFRIPINEKQDADGAKKVKRFYAFASGFGETARETLHGGVVRGIFSRVLLAGLQGGAGTDGQGRLTTTLLRKYLETELGKITVDGESLRPRFPASEEIVLAEGIAPSQTIVNLQFTQPIQGIEVLDGGNNLAPVQPADVVSTAAGLRFLLPSGKGFVIRASGSPRLTVIKTDREEIHETL